LDLLARFLSELRAVTRTHTFVPNGRARRRSGLLPVRRSYGDMGTVFFVGVRLRSQTPYKTASPQNCFGRPLAINM
jgi:hypothetical protein